MSGTAAAAIAADALAAAARLDCRRAGDGAAAPIAVGAAPVVVGERVVSTAPRPRRRGETMSSVAMSASVVAAPRCGASADAAREVRRLGEAARPTASDAAVGASCAVGETTRCRRVRG